MELIDVKTLNNDNSFESLSTNDLDELVAKGVTKKWPRTPFPINNDINKKVLIYDGSFETLKGDALVNPTNENLTSLALVGKLAGPELESYLKKKVKLCSTGDVRITPGFKSNFRYIIHAVPPKYQPKYKTAAETALFHTYFRILETMIEKKIRNIVMPILATSKCNLPIEENCHLQLRIIRRILEQKGQEFDKIVVHVQSIDKYRIPYYCYFPRTAQDEAVACYYFSGSIGGPNGEPIIPEREIRIKSKPAILDPYNQSIDLTSGLDLSTVVGKTAFSKMRDDLDKQRQALQTNQVALPSPRRNVFRGCTLL